MLNTYAVFTGDLVNSTGMSNIQVESVFRQLDNCVRSIAEEFNAGLIPVERFRGDGWQFGLSSPALSLRACLLVRSVFRQVDKTVDTRISIGVGDASIGMTAGASNGPAFLLSGRGLDLMGKRERFRYDQADGDLRLLTVVQAVFGLADALSAGWTARQAEIFNIMVGKRNTTLGEAAEIDGKTYQQVQKLFVRGDGPALNKAIESFEAAWRL